MAVLAAGIEVKTVIGGRPTPVALTEVTDPTDLPTVLETVDAAANRLTEMRDALGERYAYDAVVRMVGRVRCSRPDGAPTTTSRTAP